MNARFQNGTFIQGGVNAQRRHQDYCNAPIIASVPGVTGTTNLQADNPESRFCDSTSPFRPDVKFLVSHRFPWDVLVSGSYQFTQGPNILATWAAPNSLIAPALGRNLAAGATATKTIALVEPNTLYGEPESARPPCVEAVHGQPTPLPCGRGSLQRAEQQLAVHPQQHVRDRGHEPVAASDQRAAGSPVQDRRAVRLLSSQGGWVR